MKVDSVYSLCIFCYGDCQASHIRENMFSVLILFCILIGVQVLLSAVNKSIGARKLYVQLLLKIFEFGRANIESQRENASNQKHSSKDKSEEKVSTANGNPGDIINNGNLLISRDNVLQPVESVSPNFQPQPNNVQGSFHLEKCLSYVKAGVEAIIEDEVTSRFEAEELKNWNLLTRTNRRYEFISWKLTIMWMTGFVVRYLILMPTRVVVCFIGVMISIVSSIFVALIPFHFLRQPCANLCYQLMFRFLTRSLSTLIYVHNEEYKPKAMGFCVANHTSPIDIAVLSTDCTFSLIGQSHGGFLGLLQRALARASPHIWFERAESKDRHAVAERLRQHVSDPKNPPILIFPEGTCINNTSVMQFKKGSFEVGGTIYPVAIKYDPRFGDAFWNSSKYSMMQYLYMMMTSWAIVCDVWYLPPMYRQEGESAIDFANRVKSVIAKQGGLVDLAWDGQLKRLKPKKEWREMQQIEFAKSLKND